MLKTKKTTKKFYNKWLYKVSLKIAGVAVFRMYSYDQILAEAYVKPNMNHYSLGFKASANKEILNQLALYLKSLDQNDWSKRIETSTLDIYTNNVEIYNALVKDYDSYVVHNFEPDLADISTLENSGSIVVTKYPHGCYKFKVYLLPHKIKDLEDKKAFVNWFDTQGTKMLITESVKKWFINTSWNWDRRYVHVEDEQSLLMLKLRGGSAVGRVYDYVIRDK